MLSLWTGEKIKATQYEEDHESNSSLEPVVGRENYRAIVNDFKNQSLRNQYKKLAGEGVLVQMNKWFDWRHEGH